MNFNGSRLGFWFNSQNRASKSNRVLVFYDTFTYAYTSNGEIYDYYSSGDVNPGTMIWPVIQGREILAGFEPELVVGYSNLPEDLSVYAHIWDIGYVSPYASNPSDPTNAIIQYLQGGGALFFLGENASLNQGPVEPTRWGTIIDVLDLLGETITISPNFYGEITSTIKPEFLIANDNNVLVTSAPGSYNSIGNGTYMTTPLSEAVNLAVMWTTGTLSNAPLGAIISVLDVNFLTSYYLQVDFIDNLIASLNQR